MNKIIPLTTTIILRGIKTDLNSSAGCQFVTDCTRAGESLITDQELMEKYELTPAEFQKISTNKTLIRAIRAEGQRRVNLGTAAREAAAKIFVRAPGVLGTILDDQHASPKHRIESARELRATALGSNGDEKTADNNERISIVINMGEGHVEHFEKTITPKPPVIEGKADVDE